jgi:hypothetical protein
MPSPEIEELGHSLSASIAAGRFAEAERLMDRLVALHTIETHRAIIAALERARQVALVERSIAAERRAHSRQAAVYSMSSPEAAFLAQG